MLTINFLRALAVLFGTGLYQIYNKSFLSWDQGLVIFILAFLGLTLLEVVEAAAEDGFNRKFPRT